MKKHNPFCKQNKRKEQVMQAVFFIAACASIFAVALICLFLFVNGIPAMKEIGFFSFLLGERWKPGNNIFGIFPMIMGSIYVTAGAIGILTSIFMAEYCPKKIYPFLKSATELLAGIPSVVYGFFGLVVLVPLIRGMFREGNGSSMLTASILLGIMILPTIIAGDRIAGKQPRLPRGILRGVRTMTANIVLEMGYAADLHREALIATGVVLFVFILLINFCVALLNRRNRHA